MKFQSSKTWGAEQGLSCTFRQWRANTSHCKFLHGYSIGVKLTFETEKLDYRNWCYDFGNTKWIKEILVTQFDHTTVIAFDDPEVDTFSLMARAGLIQLRLVEAVGCEKFAEWIFKEIATRIHTETHGRVRVASVEVFEHGANSAKVIA